MDIRCLKKIYSDIEWKNVLKNITLNNSSKYFYSHPDNSISLYNSLNSKGFRIISIKDSEYPEYMYPYPIFFAKGIELENNSLKVAIVGSRNASYQGRTISANLGYSLSISGINIISDLSRGISISAQKQALKARGGNIVIQPLNAGFYYPVYNDVFIDSITKKGTVIWIFPPSEKRKRIFLSNFKTSNCFTAYLADVIIFIEGTKKSGTISLIKQAADIGKEILVWKNNNYPQNELSEMLIEDGCRSFRKKEEILEYFNINICTTKKNISDHLKKNIINIIKNPIPFSLLIERLDEKPEVIISKLSEMEVNGLIERFEGGLIRKVDN